MQSTTHSSTRMKTRNTATKTHNPMNRNHITASIMGVRSSSFLDPRQTGAMPVQYVTFQDITAAFLKIMVSRKGISLDQVAKVTRLSKTTIEEILDNKPGSQMSLNTLYLLLTSLMRIDMGALDDIFALSVANLTIAHNIKISEVKNSLRNATRLPQKDLEKRLAEPVTMWAYSNGYLSNKIFA